MTRAVVSSRKGYYSEPPRFRAISYCWIALINTIVPQIINWAGSDSRRVNNSFAIYKLLSKGEFEPISPSSHYSIAYVQVVVLNVRLTDLQRIISWCSAHDKKSSILISEGKCSCSYRWLIIYINTRSCKAVNITGKRPIIKSIAFAIYTPVPVSLYHRSHPDETWLLMYMLVPSIINCVW